MIKVTLAKLRNELFLSAIRKIANCSNFKTLRATYETSKVVKKLDEAMRQSDILVKESIEKNVVKDENGKPIIENNHYNILPEKIATFDQEQKEMLETCEVEIECEPINLDLLDGVALTVNEILAIDFLIKA